MSIDQGQSKGQARPGQGVQEANPKRWAILAAVGVGTVMSTLDASVVNIAMPTITEAFKTTISVSQWVSAAYLLTISSLLLTYGRSGDMYGHKKVYVLGFAIFTISSMLCGFSPTIGTLIAARVIQALGAGMMMATSPAIITAAFPPTERGKALGANGTIVATGLAIGPVLGGFLVGALGWRSIFFINLPIGVAGSIWALKTIPNTRPESHNRKFDLLGATTIFIALFSWLLALSMAEEWGWVAPRTLALWILGAISLIAFLRVESTAGDPMVDLKLFKIQAFSAASGTALLNFLAQYSVVFLTPFYLQQVLKLAPDKSGAILLASPLIMMVVAPLAGSMSDKIGPYRLAPVGMLLVVGGLFAMSRLGASSAAPDIIWRLALIGLGTAIFQAPNNSVMMGSVPRTRLGLASGMLATVRNVGMVLGIATSSAVFSARRAFYLAQSADSVGQHTYSISQAFMRALSDTFIVGAVLALVGFGTSLLGRPKKTQ